MMAAAFAGACGDDGGGDDKEPEDSGSPVDAATRNDAGRDASMDSGPLDAGRDSGTDAGRDGGTRDAGPVAVAGEDAPTLTAVGYFNDALGRRILISGSDKNGDIATYTITYYSDLAGTMTVDIDEDGDSSTPGTSPTSTKPIPHDAAYADFFLKSVPTEVFLSMVKAVRIKVTDAGGRTSEEKLAAFRMAPAASGSCDPNGFNLCSGGGICTPNANNDNYSCAAVANARQQACSSNAILTLAAPGSVSGTLNNASFWDAPTGCVGGDMATGLPDRIVKVTLAAPAATLTLSPGADASFDVGIYQLPTATPMCKDNPPVCGDTGCASCSDTGVSGPLVLTNVAAGDWYFVIEQFPSEKDGDTFTITATVQ
jgi:hypothetical protein